jgi:hypothetical protein
VELQSRVDRSKKDSISVGDAVTVAMAPDEIFIVIRLEGYAHQPEAQ